MKAWNHLQGKEFTPKPDEVYRETKWEQDYIWLENGLVLRSMRDGRYTNDDDGSDWAQCYEWQLGPILVHNGYYTKL